MNRFLVLILLCLVPVLALAQTPTPCPMIRWHQEGDNPAITEWRVCLDYATTQSCMVGHILTIPRGEATPEAVPGDYAACLPPWVRPDQPELYLVACDSAMCSSYSNAWPTRTWSPTATLTPTGTTTMTGTPTSTATAVPTWTARPTYTPFPTWTPYPTLTPTSTPPYTPTPSTTPTPFNPPILISICVAANAQGTPIPCP